jgi:hypothetical protein
MPEQPTPQNQDPAGAATDEELETEELEEVAGGGATNMNCPAICGSQVEP